MKRTMENSENHNLNRVRHEDSMAFLEAQLSDIKVLLAEAYKINDMIGIMTYQSRLNDLNIEKNNKE